VIATGVSAATVARSASAVINGRGVPAISS